MRSRSSSRRIGVALSRAARVRYAARARIGPSPARSTSPCTGSASRTMLRRPSLTTVSRPARSTSTSPGSFSSSASGSGSPSATCSTTTRPAGSHPRSRSATSSPRYPSPHRPPYHCQIPPSMRSAPPARALHTTSRRYRGFPAARRRSTILAGPQTSPSTACRTSSSTVSSGSGRTSTRRASSSFHSAATASGAGVLSRTVATTRAARCTARCWTRAAEASSSACASSTASIAGRFASGPRRRCATSRNGCHRGASAGSSGSRCASAPSGTDAAAWVALISSTGYPADRAALAAARSSRLRPTPGGPLNTSPRPVGSCSVLSIARSSCSRPSSGQVCSIGIPPIAMHAPQPVGGSS